jgi:hypothetical protein
MANSLVELIDAIIRSPGATDCSEASQKSRWVGLSKWWTGADRLSPLRQEQIIFHDACLDPHSQRLRQGNCSMMAGQYLGGNA